MRSVIVQVFDSKGQVVQTLNFLNTPLTIGRDASCEIQLGDVLCSRQHAIIEERHGKIWFVDQNSSNGSFSSRNKKISEIQIKKNSRFRIGDHWIEITITKKTSLKKNHSADFLELTSNFCASPYAAVLALILTTIGGYFAYHQKQFQSPLICFAPFVGTIIASFLFSILSIALCKIFSSETSFQQLYVSYLPYGAITTLLHLLMLNAINNHPEGSIQTAVILCGELALILFYFLLNLHWIWNVGEKTLASLAAVFAVAILFTGTNAFKKTKPRWGVVMESPQLFSFACKSIDPETYVPPSQFLSEMEVSLEKSNK